MSELAPRPSYLYPILPQHDRWAWYERVLTFQADGNSTGVGAARGPGVRRGRRGRLGVGSDDSVQVVPVIVVGLTRIVAAP